MKLAPNFSGRFLALLATLATALSARTPAVFAAGCVVEQATYLDMIQPPVAVALAIQSTYWLGRPLLLNQSASQSGATTLTFTPDNASSPGKWRTLIYGVIIDVIIPGDKAVAQFTLTINWSNMYAEAMTQVLVVKPTPAEGREPYRCVIVALPAIRHMGSYYYQPVGYSPILATVELGAAVNVTIVTSTTLPDGSGISATLLTQGQGDCDEIAFAVSSALYGRTIVDDGADEASGS